MQLISFELFFLAFLTLLLYALCPKRVRWVILLLSSAVFFCFSGLFSLLLILFYTLSSYILALVVQGTLRQESVLDKRKKGFFICLLGCFALVLCFTLVRELSPIGAVGISFYSLRVISYLVDVYRGKIVAERNFFKYALFATFFPLAFLGPLSLYRDIKESLYKGDSPCFEDIVSGIFRISYGAFKKLVIANALTSPLYTMAEDTDRYCGLYIAFVIVFYTVLVYCDFSGGIDICLGLSRLFGITPHENFDRPFLSTSTREFWNRWHITLGEWFEEYVFYPLSFSRIMQGFSRRCRKMFGPRIGKRLPLYIATMLTWILTGLWHGLKGHFVAWGLINGVIVLVSRELDVGKRRKEKSKLTDLLRRIRVFFVIGAVRMLDLYKSLSVSIKMLGGMILSPFSSRPFLTGLFEAIDPLSLCVVMGALLVLLFVGDAKDYSKRMGKSPHAVILCTLFLIVSTLVLGKYGQGFDSSDFIYSHFNGG